MFCYFGYLNLYIFLNIQMQVQQQQNQFVIQLQKLMTSEVASTLWSSNMDLLALITFDNLIQLYRISYKAQLVFQIQEDKNIKGFAFSPDSQLLAYGLSDGSIQIVRTENGEKILCLDGAHSTEVQTLTFTPYCSLQSTIFMPFHKNTLQSKLILPIGPHKNCNRNAIIKINYFTELKQDFNILLSSEKTKTIVLLNGFMPIAEINYLSLGFSAPKVLYAHYGDKIRIIVGQEKGLKTELFLIESETKVIEQWKEPLIKASCFFGYISEVFSFVESAYSAAELIIRDALRQYNSKMNLIDDPNVQNLSPCEQLFRFLNCGVTSTAVVNFFTKQVFDTKILQKLDQTLNALFSQLHDLLLQSIQNSLQRSMLLLVKLKDLAEGCQGKDLGLDVSNLSNAEAKLIKLYTMGEVLLVESTQAKFDIRNLLVWLNKATIKSSGQNQTEIQNSKSYLNKYTVDYARLHGFLLQQGKFKLQNLLTFFSKGNESHRLNIQKPDFEIFSTQIQNKRSAEEIETFNKLAAAFGVEDVRVNQVQHMQIEETYRSFKLQLNDLKSDWKQLSRQPVQKISSHLVQGWQKTSLGQVQQSQLFPFELKPLLKQSQLLIYFIERLQSKDILVQYNCHTHIRCSVASTQSHILTFAVSDHILTVLQNKYNGKKIVAQIANEELDGGEIIIGKRITRVQGELDIDCSMRGLNSLVTDKNKLIIFD